MRKIGFILLSCLCFFTAEAQELLKLQAEARVDYQREYIGGEAIRPHSGFRGKYLNIMLNGNLNEHFSYSYRQRLNKMHADQSFFDATDWVNLTYRPDDHWSFSAGKLVVGIGGYEYDRAPIDLYFTSEFWNNIPCYQLGVNIGYAFKGGKDQLVLQFCQSPFRAHGDDMYAYNLSWYGSHGKLSTIYSLNLMEYLPHKFINYIALGHRLDFGKVTLEADLMNRASSHQVFFFKDFSVMAEVAFRPLSWLNVFGKVTYDVNKTESAADYCVMPGTELTYLGGGLEFYPLKGNRDVRIHATYSHSFGTNGNPDGTLPGKQDMLYVGLKWRVDLLSLAHNWKRNKR